MKTSLDPSWHRQREQSFVSHVERLLSDPRLRLDTIRGRRDITEFEKTVVKLDGGVEVKRLMGEMGKPDRELQGRMPMGESLDVTLTRTRWWILKTPVGRMRVQCLSPGRSLLAGETPRPMTTGELQKVLSELKAEKPVPTTVVLMSTSGFTLEAHELAERRADRTVILVEPNDAGGWAVRGPTETQALNELFDPEAEEEKRERVRAAIESGRGELSNSGLAADRVAAKTKLSPQLIEAELKSYAKENPGLVAKRLDGRVVLFREGSATPMPGGSTMPLVNRIKSLFSLKGENEKKVAFLSERRTAFSQQRDRAYEDMAGLEEREISLRQEFKDATGAITKRRVTSQLVQLRKDIERRQQLLTVLNQQINVVSTHLHNLELVQQGQTPQLPDSEEMATDAAAAEEMLATLQADNELADSVGGVANAGMTDEEQALYEELERESAGGEIPGTKINLDAMETEEEAEAQIKNRAPRQPARPEKRPGEAEAG